MAYITADQERSYARKAATEALTQVAHRIEGEISRELQVAETLASSAALDQGNLGDFYREATRIVAVRPLWETAALTKPVVADCRQEGSPRTGSRSSLRSQTLPRSSTYLSCVDGGRSRYDFRECPHQRPHRSAGYSAC